MLLAIGLDGATWDLIDPWIAAGQLPHLARLKHNGLHGPLQSTTPPATLPSWTSFATGCNPGRHGVFDFTRRVFGTYEVQFVNATFRKQPSVWRRLSDAGLRVAVLGVPGTFPPEQLNGCMVSGFDTPVTTRADDSFVTPPELAADVRAAGGFPFADFQEFDVGGEWYALALQRLLEGIDKKVRLAKSLLARSEWDCFVLVFGESDTVAHHFWQFHDPRSPRFDAAAARGLSDAILDVYRRLDAAIGELSEASAAEAVMVLSDHGFGGAGRRVFHINRCLGALGFQQREEKRSGVAARLKTLALTSVPARWQARAFRLHGGRWASRLESRTRFAGIRWDRTRAFSEELNYFPNVWLNLRGREPNGTVDRIDYERVRNDICAALEAVLDPNTGTAVVRRAWRREELYRGPWVSSAPDIVLELALEQGYSYNCLPSRGGGENGFLRNLEDHELGGGKIFGMGGSHRPEGIFILTGEGQGKVEGAKIEDMGATMLAHFGLPISDLDGRAIGVRERLMGESAAALDPIDEVPYDAAEQAEIEERLGALGYL